MIRTPLTDLLGIRHPIVQTGMGYVSGARLTAATSAAGGLGIIASATMSPETLRSVIKEVKERTDAPIGVQRELMRHASIQTTMNVYGRAVAEGKRQAHSSVVQMVMKEELRETATPSKRGKTGTAG